jgi:tetratricopeptide (TPR) repeat protein
MRWRSRLSPLRRGELDQLRYYAQHDPSYRRPRAVELLNTASDLFERKRSRESIRILDELIGVLQTDSGAATREPDFLLFSARGMLGSALFDSGRPDQAEGHLAQALAQAKILEETATKSDHVVVVVSVLTYMSRCRELANARDDALGFAQLALDLLQEHASDPTIAADLPMIRALRDRLQ